MWLHNVQKIILFSDGFVKSVYNINKIKFVCCEPFRLLYLICVNQCIIQVMLYL